jgi:hypothetical protein
MAGIKFKGIHKDKIGEFITGILIVFDHKNIIKIDFNEKIKYFLVQDRTKSLFFF